LGPSPTILEIIYCCLIWDCVPYLLPLRIHGVTVEVFYPTSTWGDNPLDITMAI
jgi:hypothetical protein